MGGRDKGCRVSGRRCRACAGTLVAAALWSACHGAPRPPNVVLITVESTRVDHLGVYGGHSPTRPDVPVTPHLDALGREAVVYSDAHAVTSWTLTSHASLFTGLYPTAHQTVGPLDRLADSYLTLAERLVARGYQTVGIASGHYLRRVHNLSQGFELYDDSIAAPGPEGHEAVTNPAMEASLQRFFDRDRDPERPFFLFAYFWDPHYDYIPPKPYDETFVTAHCERFDLTRYEGNPEVRKGMSPARLDYVLSQYDGELRATDDVLGRFFTELRRRDLWDDTLVIVTSDHGEEFFDHGHKGHKKNLYGETVRVPLLIKYPRGEPRGLDERLVSHVDVLPTVLEVVGAAPEPGLDGRSLLASPADDRPVLFELLSLWNYLQPDGSWRERRERWEGIRRGRFKLLAHEDSGSKPGDAAARVELYDVREDPGERRDLADAQGERLHALVRALKQALDAERQEAASHRSGGRATLSPDERRRLESLGYLTPH